MVLSLEVARFVSLYLQIPVLIMIFESKLFTFIQDVGVCYAFVEFEDMTGVYNAVKVWIFFLMISLGYALLMNCDVVMHLDPNLILNLVSMNVYVISCLFFTFAGRICSNSRETSIH